MVRTAARDRHDEGGVSGAQPHREILGRPGIGGELAARRGAGLGDLGGHERFGHRDAPSDRARACADSVSSATKS